MATTEETTTTPQATATLLRGLGIVLFGLPGAGKTSLLGALAQAAETEQPGLGGRFRTLPAELLELRAQVYGSGTARTTEELVGYPLQFSSRDHHGFLEATVFDCDGEAANALLAEQLADESGDGTPERLVQAVVHADALILAVDASARPDERERDFAEFLWFLRQLRRRRARRRAVGGLPVFLVLTKCDLLPLAEDADFEDWQRRIHERAMQVQHHFREFMARQAAAEDQWHAFGSLDLDVRATAVRHPVLHDLPTASRPEPHGVGSLFHDAFVAAQAYQTRQTGSTRRLVWTVLGSLGVVSLMIGIGLGLLLTRKPTEELQLLNKIRNYQAREGQTAAFRLAEGRYLESLRELTELSRDPDFDKLPAEEQDFVRDRLKELKAYDNYRTKLFTQQGPAQARSLQELNYINELLSAAALKVPENYRDDWSQTEAVLLQEKWLNDVALLDQAVKELTKWYRDLIRAENSTTDNGEPVMDATQLLGADRLNAAWARGLRILLKKAESPPHRAVEMIEESRSLPIRQGRALTYANAYAFEEVERARADWEALRSQLLMVRDLGQAVGLLVEPTLRQAVLAPEQLGPELNSEQQLERLDIYYPDYQNWRLSRLPEQLQEDIRQRLEESYQELIVYGRDQLQQQLRSIRAVGKPTQADWKRLAEDLSRGMVPAWRKLLQVVGNLIEPNQPDEVAKLIAFLSRDSFAIDVKSVYVKIPEDDVASQQLRPVGDFKLFLQPAASNAGRAPRLQSLTLTPANAGARDIAGWYRFDAPSDVERWTYQPGDKIWAELNVRQANVNDWILMWTDYRSPIYRIDGLQQPPRLVPPRDRQKPKPGSREPGIRLRIQPPQGIPEVPALLPDMTEGS